MKWFCLGTVPCIQTDNSYPFLREIAFESFCLLLFAANTNHEKKRVAHIVTMTSFGLNELGFVPLLQPLAEFSGMASPGFTFH